MDKMLVRDITTGEGWLIPHDPDMSRFQTVDRWIYRRVMGIDRGYRTVNAIMADPDIAPKRISFNAWRVARWEFGVPNNNLGVLRNQNNVARETVNLDKRPTSVYPR